MVCSFSEGRENKDEEKSIRNIIWKKDGKYGGND